MKSKVGERANAIDRTHGYMLYDKESVPYMTTLADSAKNCWNRMKISKKLALQVGWKCKRVIIQPSN